MKKVDRNFVKKVEELMYAKALDLEVARFNLIFEDMPAQYVIIALSMYQNKDGGFAHALDPDNLNPNSTAYETEKALEVIDSLGFTKDNLDEEVKELLNNSFTYLYNRAQRVDDMFIINELSNKKYACANRFNESDKDSDLALTLNIIYYTLKYVDEKKAIYKKAIKLLDKVLTFDFNFNNVEVIKAYERISLFKKELKDNALMQKENYVEGLNLNRFNYLDILYLYDEYSLNQDINIKIDGALDILISEIKPHGMWEAMHNWGDGNIYPEGDAAMLKWLGKVTYNAMYYLQKFGRIED
jgi:hypothetical protein